MSKMSKQEKQKMSLVEAIAALRNNEKAAYININGTIISKLDALSNDFTITDDTGGSHPPKDPNHPPT